VTPGVLIETEYISVVPYYLITMSKSSMIYTTSGQDCLLFPILTLRTMSLTNQRMYFVQLAINLLIPTVEQMTNVVKQTFI
jgi:ABC-type uncharacterized transport system YnjBCD permease subunit